MKAFDRTCLYGIWLSFACSTSLAFSDLTSPNGSISFETRSGSPSVVLNSTGLGIFTTPSSNLQVQGNALISENLSIGSSTSPSSSLNIAGSLGFSSASTSDNLTIPEQGGHSLYFIDNSAGNIVVTLPYAGNVTGRQIILKTTSNAHDLFVHAIACDIDQQYAVILRGSEEQFPTLTIVSSTNTWLQLSYLGSLITAYTPSQASSSIWLDADNEASFTFYSTTNYVNAWTDRGPSGYVFNKIVTGEAPNWGGNVLNGRPVLDFDSVDDQLEASPGPQPGGNNQMILMVAQLNTDHDGRILTLRDGTGTRNGLLPNNSSTSAYTHNSSFAPVRSSHQIDIGQPFLLSGYRSGATIGISQNGITDATNGSGGTVSTIEGWHVGSYKRLSNNLHGYIAEIIVIDAFESTTYAKLQGYLAWKWGLVDRLDNSHPYKHVPPL